MAKKNMDDPHVQCKLINEDGAYHTCWIPKKHAKKNVVITFKDYPGTWTVGEVFDSTVLSGHTVWEMSRRHAKWRESTDV